MLKSDRAKVKLETLDELRVKLNALMAARATRGLRWVDGTWVTDAIGKMEREIKRDISA